MRLPIPLLLLAACSSVPNEPAAPYLAEGPDAVRVTLEEDFWIDYDPAPFQIRTVRIGGEDLEYPEGAFLRVNDRPAGASLRGEPSMEGRVAFPLLVDLTPSADGGRRMIEAVEPLRLGEARGFRRTVEQDPAADPSAGREWPPTVTMGAGLGVDRTVFDDEYGYSTVSDPGVTYELHYRDLPSGHRMWLYRSFFHVMNQALNPGIDPRLEEVVLLDATGTVSVDEIVSELVTVEQDRERLIKTYGR